MKILFYIFISTLSVALIAAAGAGEFKGTKCYECNNVIGEDVCTEVSSKTPNITTNRPIGCSKIEGVYIGGAGLNLEIKKNTRFITRSGGVNCAMLLGEPEIVLAYKDVKCYNCDGDFCNAANKISNISIFILIISVSLIFLKQ